MKIALYKGKSPVSLAIRWLTRSPYSHAAFVFDTGSESASRSMLASGAVLRGLDHYSAGSVVEAWAGGVKNSPSISTLHTPGTEVDLFAFQEPLSEVEERALVRQAASQIGDPYSYWNVLKFLSRRPGNLDGSWFCSELCFEDCRVAGRDLLLRVSAWEVPPHWIHLSPLLRLEATVVTQKEGATRG